MREKSRWTRHALTALLLCAACASTRSARYVQFTAIQANLNNRAAEALDLGLIDAATGKRILAISEAVSAQRARYREALAAGGDPRLLDAILEVMHRLLGRADLFLPDPLLLRKEGG